jgi:four helix bundle protein
MPKEIRNPKSDKPHVNGDVWMGDARFWDWAVEAADREMALRDEPQRDLMERTAEFGEMTGRFAKKIPNTPENIRLISQVVAAGTSVGANYCEADDSVSGKDFKKSIGFCRKESKETMFFLRMIAASEESLRDEARVLWRKAK